MKDDIQAIKSFVQDLNDNPGFAIGDVVAWKGEEFKNKCRPDLSQRAVVSYVYPEPIFNSDGERSGTPYEFEPIDIRLVFIDEEGDYMEYAYDSRRFRLANLP